MSLDYQALLEGVRPDLTGLTDAQIVDMVGELNAVIAKLNTVKRELLSEVSGPVRGESYQLVTSNYAARSYNSAALLGAFADAGLSLPDLLRADAVRLHWQWTNLNRAARGKVDLRVTQREIDDDGDLEGPMVGEVWRTKDELKGVTS